MNSPRVVGIDLSETSTGLACIAEDDEILLHRVRSTAPKTPKLPGKRKPEPPTLAQRQERLERIVQRVREWAILERRPDLVVIEGPAYSSSLGHMHDRSGLWWMLVTSLFWHGIPVAEVAPTARAKYGAGKAVDKDQVFAAVIRRYIDVPVTGNDTADALLLAAMGRRYLGRPIEESLPKPHLEAIAKVRWPEGLEAGSFNLEPAPY